MPLPVMDKIGGWAEENWVRSRVAGKHVDFRESSDVQWAKQRAELQAPQNQIHHGSHELVCGDALDELVCVSELTSHVGKAR